MVEEYYIYVSKFLEIVQIFFNYTRTRYISSLFLSIKFKNVSHERKREKEKDIVYESTKFF